MPFEVKIGVSTKKKKKNSIDSPQKIMTRIII